jgi:hypothetical protein
MTGIRTLGGTPAPAVPLAGEWLPAWSRRRRLGSTGVTGAMTPPLASDDLMASNPAPSASLSPAPASPMAGAALDLGVIYDSDPAMARRPRSFDFIYPQPVAKGSSALDRMTFLGMVTESALRKPVPRPAWKPGGRAKFEFTTETAASARCMNCMLASLPASARTTPAS